MMNKQRIRTESMVERYKKTNISEGYDLWDRGYPLGAIRLFLFKSETAPPFQLGPCLDAIAEISLQLNGIEDAREQYVLAADKYQVLQQPVLAELMRTKMMAIVSGKAAALDRLQSYLATTDPDRNGGGGEKADAKTRGALARCYAYLSYLLLAVASEEGGEDAESAVAPQAVEAAQLAVSLGWDRVHLGYAALGDAYDALGDLDKAKEAFAKAVQIRPSYTLALENLVDVMQRLELPSEEIMPVLDQAIAAHPHAGMLRTKAFLICSAEGDTAGLAFVDDLLSKPPLEEAESIDKVGGRTMGTLLKAKAAILADLGRFGEALAAAKEAVAADPKDEEAAQVVEDIEETMKQS